MNTKQLTYFLKAAELNSIAAAARELDIAQPSISLQIQNLEHELNAKLFDRDFRGVVLTDSGQRFYDHARAIVRQIEQAKRDIRQSEEEPSGRLAIGMTQPIGNIVSVPLLKMVEERFPKISLDLFAGLSYSLSNQVKAGELDITISSPDGTDVSHLRREWLFRERLFLAIGNDPVLESLKELRRCDRIPFDELAKHEIIVTGRQDSLGYLLHQYEQRTGVKLNQRPAFGQLMTTLRYVADGYGALLSPSSAFFHLELTGQVHALEVEQPEIWRDVFISTSSERPQTALIRAVIPLIRKVVRQEYDAGHWKGEIASAK